MANEIRIRRKSQKKGDDGFKIVSVRMRDDLVKKLDNLSTETNRSRNELINILLSAAIDIVKVDYSNIP